MFEQIKQHRLLNESRLIKSFDSQPIDEIVEKGITPEEFDKRYSVGYDVFDRESIDKFREDALSKGDSSEEIEKEISKLSRVLIQKGEESYPLYVIESN
jgi:hypothetical protein